MGAAPTPWWQRAVVYQIYPRSFADGTADGVGDVPGIRGRLDYLQWLGVDTIWLSPVFTSPMADFGYDVSDYCDIDPTFGSLADIDALIADCHERGMKLLLDWVPNHTSSEHPWFQESRRDRTNPRADWYVWRDAPANNWLAAFPRGESAWQFDDVRGQYYLRCFLKEQPDLNWDNPAVEAAMLDTLRFWLDRGVDGFRMDVIHLIGKDLDHNDPPDHVERGRSHVAENDSPRTHQRLRAIRAVLNSYPGERTSVGEVYLLDEGRMATYYGANDELHMSFNFKFLWLPWNAAKIRSAIMTTLDHLVPRGVWPTWVLSNHDVTRHRQRYGGSESAARVAAMMLLTLPGTPFIYQGEELGLVDAEIPADRVVDPGGRDGCRAPMPWSAEPGHGWPVEPWLPFAPEADTRNAGAQQNDADSILNLYRALLQIRRDHPALHTGGFEMIDRDDNVVAYQRVHGEQRYAVVLNLGDVPVLVGELSGARMLLSTEPHARFTATGATLGPMSGAIVQRS